jgi:hypothetical protein
MLAIAPLLLFVFLLSFASCLGPHYDPHDSGVNYFSRTIQEEVYLQTVFSAILKTPPPPSTYPVHNHLTVITHSNCLFPESIPVKDITFVHSQGVKRGVRGTTT